MIDVFFQFEKYSPAKYDIIFLVDILRASTTDVLLYAKGIQKIIYEDCYENAIKKKSKKNILIGEIQGEKPEGFDFGNSPYELKDIPLHNKNIIHFTTNGTPLFKKFEGTKNCFLASFLNSHMVVDYVMKNTLFILAGTNGKPAYEDFYFAGYILSNFPRSMWGHNGTRAAKLYYRFKNNALSLFLRTSNGKNLAKLKKQRDIVYSLQKNLFSILPGV